MYVIFGYYESETVLNLQIFYNPFVKTHFFLLLFQKKSW
jgi:hypothetical protein